MDWPRPGGRTFSYQGWAVTAVVATPARSSFDMLAKGLGVELAGSFVREVDELAGIGLGHETTAQPPDPGGLENVALGNWCCQPS